MPIRATYPGIYIEETPSRAKTIAGIGTSVTAFVGFAKRGPINKAIQILGYSDYELHFGGLSSNPERAREKNLFTER